MTAKWQRVRIEIPERFTPQQRDLIAQDIVDFIRERTNEQGRDKNGRKFSRYTTRYAKEKGQTFVDLTASDQMLDDLDVLSTKKGSILLGYENGTESNAKADGNIRGTYGQPQPIPGKQRDFLGISQRALREIIRRHDS